MTNVLIPEYFVSSPVAIGGNGANGAPFQGSLTRHVFESLAFHAARGYVELGHLDQLDGHETVMLEKVL